MKRVISILFVAVLAMPMMAQFSMDAQEQLPMIEFQSTSVMQGSGSAYSATPALNADGSIDLMGQSTTPSGPRKIGGVTPNTDPMPVGDALIPLLLMAIVFAGVIAYRRKKA